MSNETSPSTALQAPSTSFFNVPKNRQLNRQERIKIRNQILIDDYYTGASKEEIATKFHISLRQVQSIIHDIEEGGHEWLGSLPKQAMITIHRTHSRLIHEEIKSLVNQRMDAENPKEKWKCTLDIIDAYIKYDRMIAEGATLERVKEITDRAEEVLASKT